MSTQRLYIGNIDFDATEDGLRELLRAYQPLEIRIAFDRRSGKPRGFAHATVASQTLAEAAVTNLDGSTWMGRRLVVAPATARGAPDMSLRKDSWSTT